MYKFLLCTLALFIVNISLNGQQRSCNTMDHLEVEIQENPKRLFKMEQIQKHLDKFISNSGNKSAQLYTIPVVVHIVHNNNAQNISDSQILSQLTVLNDDFRRMNSDANDDWPQAADRS